MSFMGKLINVEELPLFFKLSQLKLRKNKSMRSVRYSVHELLKQKKIAKIGNEYYTKTSNPFFVATQVYKGYIGFSSALYILGLKNETEANVYVCTSSKNKTMNFLDKQLVPVNMSRYFYGTTILVYGDLEVLTSTLPKTIFDMFYKIRYLDVQNVYRALAQRNLTRKEWVELMSFAAVASISVARRIGYSLEQFAPADILDKLKRLSDNVTGPSFYYEHRYENYNKKWRIFDTLNIKRWR